MAASSVDQIAATMAKEAALSRPIATVIDNPLEYAISVLNTDAKDAIKRLETLERASRNTQSAIKTLNSDIQVLIARVDALERERFASGRTLKEIQADIQKTRQRLSEAGAVPATQP